MCLSLPALVVSLLPAVANAAPWSQADAMAFTDGGNYFTTDVEIADFNNDGFPDLMFANVGGWTEGTPDSALPNQAFLNDGMGNFTDVSVAVFGGEPDATEPNPDTGRVIKVRDVNGDGIADIFVGAAWESRSRLFIYDPDNMDNQFGLTEVSGTNIPQTNHSIGDAEFGDVDGDGDLDLVLTQWGPIPVGNPGSIGGRTMLWTNDGTGVFTDATGSNMPDINLQWTWDVELVDLDNDYDLDAVVSCRACSFGSVLFQNDGNGMFFDITQDKLPMNLGAVAHRPMDLDEDGFLDLISLQDGEGGGAEGYRNRVLINTGNAGYTDETTNWWPLIDNPASFDYGLSYLDYDSDGDPDALLGSFAQWVDRVMMHEGSNLVTGPPPYGPVVTDGTLDVDVADLNGDFKIDAVVGEGLNAFQNFVMFGEDVMEDTGVPEIPMSEMIPMDAMWGDQVILHARVHDNKSPTYPHDWTDVYFEYAIDGGDIDVDAVQVPGWWYGEYLWTYDVTIPVADTMTYRYCAIDAAGNGYCGPTTDFMPVPSDTTGSTTDDSASTTATGTLTMTDSDTASQTDSDSDSDSNSMTMTMTDTMTAGPTSASDSETDSETAAPMLDDDGCDCTARGDGAGWSSLALLGLLAFRRRRDRF